MTIERHKLRLRNIGRIRMTQLLGLIGVPRRQLYAGKNREGRPFWNQPEWALQDLAALARGLYLRRLKAAHPDAGGSNEEAAELTTAWQRVKLLFGRHGIEV